MGKSMFDNNALGTTRAVQAVEGLLKELLVEQKRTNELLENLAANMHHLAVQGVPA